MVNTNVLDDYFASLGMFRKSTARDPTCLYRAVSEQLFLTQSRYSEVRDACICFIELHRELFESLVEAPFEWYLSQMKNEKSWASIVELKAISLLFKRDIIIYREIGKPPINALGNCFKETLTLCFSSGTHYDSIYPKTFIEHSGFCQALVYECLYRGVFHLDAEITIAVDMLRSKLGKMRLDSCCSVDSDRPNSPSPEVLVNTDSSELESSTEVKDKDKAKHVKRDAEMRRALTLHAQNIPLPYKVAKSLDPDHYRNVEFDVWLESVRECEREMELKMLTSEYIPGDKVLVHMEGSLYHAHVQEIASDKGPVTVFVEETGNKHEVPYESLEQHPFNTRPLSPWRSQGARAMSGSYIPMGRVGSGRGRKRMFKKRFRDYYPMPFNGLVSSGFSHPRFQHGMNVCPMQTNFNRGYRGGRGNRNYNYNRGGYQAKTRWYSGNSRSSWEAQPRARHHSCSSADMESACRVPKSNVNCSDNIPEDYGRPDSRHSLNGSAHSISSPQPVPAQRCGDIPQEPQLLSSSAPPSSDISCQVMTSSQLPVTYVPYVPYLVVPGVDISSVNFNIEPSKDPRGSDLPLTDPGTLRFFFNYGVESFRVSASMQQQQQVTAFQPPCSLTTAASTHTVSWSCGYASSCGYPTVVPAHEDSSSASPDEHCSSSNERSSPSYEKNSELVAGPLDVSTSPETDGVTDSKPVYVPMVNNNYVYLAPDGIPVVTPQQDMRPPFFLQEPPEQRYMINMNKLNTYERGCCLVPSTKFDQQRLDKSYPLDSQFMATTLAERNAGCGFSGPPGFVGPTSGYYPVTPTPPPILPSVPFPSTPPPPLPVCPPNIQMM